MAQNDVIVSATRDWVGTWEHEFEYTLIDDVGSEWEFKYAREYTLHADGSLTFTASFESSRWSSPSRSCLTYRVTESGSGTLAPIGDQALYVVSLEDSGGQLNYNVHFEEIPGAVDYAEVRYSCGEEDMREERDDQPFGTCGGSSPRGFPRVCQLWRPTQSASVIDDEFEFEGAMVKIHLEHAPDRDGDLIPDDEDNCDRVDNPDQADDDQDTRGDACDNCVTDWNRSQSNDDHDRAGDVCDDEECDVLPTGIDGCSLQPGDILVWRSNTLQGSIESATFDTYWTHTAMVVGYIDLNRPRATVADSDCVDVEPASRADLDPDCELVIADALPNDPGGEVALRDIREVSWGSPNGEIERIAAFRLDGVPEATRTAAARRLRNHLLSYGGAGRAANQDPKTWRASELEYGLTPYGDRGPDDFYCSSLLWWAYEQIGVDLDTDGNDAYVTPDNLLEWSLGVTMVFGAPDPHGVVGARGDASALRRVSRSASGDSVHVMLVDPLGRRTGRDAAGTLHSEIPGADHRQTPDGQGVAADGMTDAWTVVLSDADGGLYSARRRLFDGTAVTSASFQGFLAPGEQATFALSQFPGLTGAPVAVDDTATTRGTTPVSIPVLANDLHLGSGTPDTLTVARQPSSGRAEVSGTELTYTAHDGFSGTDSFDYQVCEGGSCSVGLVTVTVAPAASDPASTGGVGAGTVPMPGAADRVPAAEPPGGKLGKLRVRLNRRRGTASLAVPVDRAGLLIVTVRARTAQRRKLGTVRRTAAQAGVVTIPLPVSAAARRSLRRRGKLRVVAIAKFAALDGAPVTTAKLPFTLRLTRRH